MSILEYQRENNLSNATATNLMIFELSVEGHYPEYVGHLIYFWNEYQIKGHLNIVVSPLFLQQHSDVVNLVEELELNNVRFTAITSTESNILKPFNTGINRNIRAWQEFRLMRKYAAKLKCDRIFIPYIDNFQIPIILHKSLGVTYSGIYFRPSFHYQKLFQNKQTWRDILQQWREKATLFLFLKDSYLKTLFCLDQLAIEQINKLSKKPKAVHVPDPVQTNESPFTNIQQLKSNLKIEESRQVYLLFGAMGKRKGLNKLLESVSLLPKNLCHQLCILLVGKMPDDLKEEYLNAIERLTSNFPVQIVIKNQYIPKEQIQSYFQLADVILAPYQRHVGMSGIINRAAEAQKPVLSSDYGLMGEITRKYQLGLTVDSTAPSDIAKGIAKLISSSHEEICDFNRMKAFAEQNKPDKFAEVIFHSLFK